jgi:hypothetical protein
MDSRHSSGGPRSPLLSAEVVRDDEALVIATDALLLGEPRLRRLSARIRRHPLGLREHADEKVFARYLELEALSNERLEVALAVVTRWAFESGRRSRR